MNNSAKYLIYICNLFLVILTVYNIFSCEISEKEISDFTLASTEGNYISYLKIDNVKKELLDDKIMEEDNTRVEIKGNIDLEQQNPIDKNTIVEIPKEEVIEEVKEDIKEERKEEVQVNVLETLIGNLVGYGPDCYGCTSMKTASGKYIGEGNIYYEDPIYGSIRIVAGDYSYPFGTIVRISNVDFYNDEPFYAIVLDRGGDIGKNKKFLFDLLFASEKDAYALGREINIKYEIMRLGY